MQRRLILLRHGHAEEGRDDFARRLTDAGRRAARQAGQALAHARFQPQLVLTSPAPRARETAELVAQGCGYDRAPRADQTLYLGEPVAYLSVLRALPEALSRVLLVGHNPTLSDLARQLGEAAELRPAEFVDLALALDGWGEL
jgi:phosphohistidine phosphatase